MDTKAFEINPFQIFFNIGTESSFKFENFEQ